MTLFFKTISWIFHPLFTATFITSILLFHDPSLLGNMHAEAVPYFILVVLLTTGLIPGFCIWWMKKVKLISDPELVNRKERLFPFLVIVVLYAIAFFMFKFNEAHSAFTSMLLMITSLIAILLVITRWFKISIHATAIWGGVGTLCSLTIFQNIVFGSVLYISLLVAGLTCSSRLYLGCHKPVEIWSGSILGFIYCFFSMALI